MSDIIRLENVVYMTQENWRAVNGISCRVRKNERVMFCGGSGSGKNALLRLIAGMEKPSSGVISVLDQAVNMMSRSEAAGFRNQYIGVVLEEPGLVDKLSVAENVSLPLIVRGMSRQRSKKAAADILSMLGIHQLAVALPAHLSSFERRTVGLARALVSKPQILLLNEVTSRLSERDAEKIVGTIRVIAEYGDFTMLWFSDSADNMLDLHRTIYLENGRIREDTK